MASERDTQEVHRLLGRPPQGNFSVVVRALDGRPVVIENDPLLDDGTPMPTRYWLVDAALTKAIGRLESDGGVAEAQDMVDADELAACHRRHGASRNECLPTDHTGPAPSGGVGGTRLGVKCLHAHYANFLAGEVDPVGEWVHQKLAQVGAEFPVEASTGTDEPVLWRNLRVHIPAVGPVLVVFVGFDHTHYLFGLNGRYQADWLADVSGAGLTRSYLLSDPPTAAELSAALSIMELHVTDAKRALHLLPAYLDDLVVLVVGDARLTVAVERGVDVAALDGKVEVAREDLEDLFRSVATETLADRAFNPGLPLERVGTFVGTLCVLIETLRQLRVDRFWSVDESSGK